jgi:phage FluMu protein Com
MKTFLLLLSLAWFGKSFAQDHYHFLLTSNSSIQITDPICKEMTEKSKEELNLQIKKMNRNKKKAINDLAVQSYIEVVQSLRADPDNLFPAYPLLPLLMKTYRETREEEMYFSLQKVTLKPLGDADIEVSIKNVQVSSSETALDMEVRNLKNQERPVQTKHLSCPTGRMLLDDFEVEQPLAWLGFWVQFYSEVKVRDWLEQAIMNVEPRLMSKTQQDILTDEKISKLGLGNKDLLIKGTEQAKRILKEVPYHIPFDETVAVLISKDEQKISLLTYHQYPQPSEFFYEEENIDVVYENEYSSIQMTKWNFEKKDGHWGIYYSDQYTDSIDHIRTFFMAGFDSENRFNEENWIKNNFSEELLFNDFRHIELIMQDASPEIESLVRTEIQSKLVNLLSEKNNPYDKFYQRISKQTSDYWEEQDTDKIIYKDVLISNPEKTAFIFPVILHNKKDNYGDFYSSEEDFKFYVLLKNADGSYTMYDWYYFKPLSYWSSYSLLRCAETHLKHISNFTEDQEIINDQAFWDNYIFKRSMRGFDYLTEVVLSNESISITKSEFDATVQDCINILSEYDVVDLYDHQLKQIIRCINTIQKGNLSGTQNLKLVSLSQELHFQKRLNKIQKPEGNYYPALNIQFGTPLEESSYYLIH